MVQCITDQQLRCRSYIAHCSSILFGKLCALVTLYIYRHPHGMLYTAIIIIIVTVYTDSAGMHAWWMNIARCCIHKESTSIGDHCTLCSFLWCYRQIMGIYMYREWRALYRVGDHTRLYVAAPGSVLYQAAAERAVQRASDSLNPRARAIREWNRTRTVDIAAFQVTCVFVQVEVILPKTHSVCRLLCTLLLLLVRSFPLSLNVLHVARFFFC